MVLGGKLDCGGKVGEGVGKATTLPLEISEMLLRLGDGRYRYVIRASIVFLKPSSPHFTGMERAGKNKIRERKGIGGRWRVSGWMDEEGEGKEKI